MTTRRESLLSVDEALRLVVEHSKVKMSVPSALVDAVGLVLAENVASDVDSPPYDKSIVDGYAVIASDLAGGEARLAILEEITAGVVPSLRVALGTTTRIMTGAPLPQGADAVIKIEHSEIIGNADRSGLGGSLGRVCLREQSVRAGQNIFRRGASMRAGDVVLHTGAILWPAEIGLLAEVGCAPIQVIPRPTVAVLSTGNELIPHDHTPGAGQIRNSNGPLLTAAARRCGAVTVDLGIARDDPQDLRRLIDDGRAADILLISGGVSAGVLDLAPGVLEQLGARRVFHKVSVKPGKPFWYGLLSSAERDTLVFGLPGNPVSCFVCFELFVRPAITILSGRTWRGHATVRAQLSRDLEHRGDRPTYHPSKLHATPSPDGIGYRVEPLPWQGSADLRALAGADALTICPAGDRAYAAGERIEVLPLDGAWQYAS